MNSDKLLTKYEIAKVIGIRATQLWNGSTPTIDPIGESDPLRIAQMELRMKKIPIKIEREFPDGTKVIISVNDLINT